MPFTNSERADYNRLLVEREAWAHRATVHQQAGRWAAYRNARRLMIKHNEAMLALVGR